MARNVNTPDQEGTSEDRWLEVRQLLEVVLELARHERAAYLDQHCTDTDLRAEIEDYLTREDVVADFIEQPASRLLGKRPPELREGERLGAYRLEEQVGQGGMGVVYLARRDDEVYDQRVAVKVLKRGLDTAAVERRFRRERRILARLDHPNVARILDGGSTEDGLPYFVMEHVAGTPVDRYCSHRALSLEERLELCRQVCETVHFAHRNLVVHCDLKPANILVSDDGVAKLLDFGIAKLLSPDDAADPATQLPWRPGTPAYMSPEQVRGESITTASDVYALGVVLHELLTGQRPERAKGSDATSTASDTPRPLPRPSTAVRTAAETHDETKARHRRRLARRLRGDLDTIVLKATHPEAERRYTSAAALAEDIRRHIVHEPISARPDGFLYRAGRFVRRRPVEVATGAGALALVLGLVVLLALQLDRTRVERDRATGLRDSFIDLLETVDLTDGNVSSEVAVDVVKAMLSHTQGLDPVDRARLFDRMGLVYSRFGLFDESRRLHQESLRLQRSAASIDTTRLAITLNNLGFVLLNLGQYEAGEALFKEALAVNPALTPEDRATELKAINNQGTFLAKKGDFAAAERIYSVVLESKRELHGEKSTEFAVGLQNLASALYRQERLEEAEPLMRQTLALREELLGDDHPMVAKTLVNLAALIDARGQSREAVKMYRRALAIRLLHVPEDHPDVARVHGALGFSLLGSGGGEKLAEAETLLRKALDVHLARRGANHQNTLVFQRNLAATLLARGRPTAAETLAQDVLERSYTAFSPGHWRIADARSVLGHCLIAQGRYAEAEDLVAESYPVIRDQRGASSRYAEEARERAVALYRGWGREEEARRFMAPESTEKNLRTE